MVADPKRWVLDEPRKWDNDRAKGWSKLICKPSKGHKKWICKQSITRWIWKNGAVRCICFSALVRISLIFLFSSRRQSEQERMHCLVWFPQATWISTPNAWWLLLLLAWCVSMSWLDIVLGLQLQQLLYYFFLERSEGLRFCRGFIRGEKLWLYCSFLEFLIVLRNTDNRVSTCVCVNPVVRTSLCA